MIGEIITYDMEERQRVKIVDYTGSKQLETTKIEEKLKEQNIVIRADTFIDAGKVRKVAGVVIDMMKEKGFQAATVTPEIKEMPGGPKLVHISFQIDEGPKIKIRAIDFVGNKDGQRRQAPQADEGEQAAHDLGRGCSPAGAPTRRRSSTRTRRRSCPTTATAATSPRASDSPS